MANFYIKKRWN